MTDIERWLALPMWSTIIDTKPDIGKVYLVTIAGGEVATCRYMGSNEWEFPRGGLSANVIAFMELPKPFEE